MASAARMNLSILQRRDLPILSAKDALMAGGYQHCGSGFL